MSIEQLMPKVTAQPEENPRGLIRANIIRLLDVLQDNGFSITSESAKQRYATEIKKLTSSDSEINCMGAFSFSEKVTEFNWLVYFDDDSVCVRVVVMFANQNGHTRQQLLDVVNSINNNLNTLFAASIDTDNDCMLEYHMPMGIPDSITAELLKRLVHENIYIMRHINNTLEPEN